jgi:hypothetical protein
MTLVWSDCGKPRLADIPPEVGTKHFPNTSLEPKTASASSCLAMN